MNRLKSLDVFRGLTVAAMVLVNSPGSDAVFAPLRHADWHGCTPTDLIFPAFLVIMGVSAAFSAAARAERGERPSDTAKRVCWRAAALLGLGLLVNFFVFDSVGGVRLPGVLQRIALCYLGVSAFLFLDRPKAEPAAAAGLLVFYWLLLALVPVPGHGPGVLTPEGNISYWLDRRLFDGHLLADRWGDPEGLLPTMSALATALLGLIAGRRLLRDGPATARALGLGGLALAAAGATWSLVLPLNKHLWTSSYALFSGGLSLAGLALCLRLAEGRRSASMAPFEALGRHALAAYVLSGLAYALMEFMKVRMPGGESGDLKLWLTARLFEPWLPAPAASVAFAVIFTVATATVALLVAQRFDRRQQ